jgi:hypothetical protein
VQNKFSQLALPALGLALALTGCRHTAQQQTAAPPGTEIHSIQSIGKTACC